MSSINSIRDTFFEECEDLLEAVHDGLAEIADGDDDSETINAVFRAVHSIKGGAGAFGLDELVNFAHRFETVLDEVRNGRLEPDAEAIGLFQRSGDMLSDIIEAARNNTPSDIAAADANIAALNSLLGFEEEQDENEAVEFEFEALSIDLGPEVDDAAPKHQFRIEFRPHRDLFTNGHEPLVLIALLDELGDLDVNVDLSELPELDALEWEDPHIQWDLTLHTEKTISAVREVFEFVDGLCDLTISEIVDEDGAAGPASDGGTGSGDLPDDLVPSAADSSGTGRRLNLGLAAEPAQPETAPPPAAPDAAAPAAETADVPPASQSSAAARKDDKSRASRATLRVDLERVDRLINTVGELIINQAMIAQRIEESGLSQGSEINVDLEDYKQLAREIQEGVMAIRAQPVKPLFQRMSRIVRESCDATGKKAQLVTDGEATEVDKTVIERLSDPLTHMIRNAIDHGLEDPKRRAEVGKSPVGVIRLSAVHRSGSVLIEIADDGAGLDRERIRKTAVEKGLISKDADLSNSDVDNLLFMPGFSTADKVSNLSGRGVGMDVVKNAITSLGGRVSISTVPGKGTTFSIYLPLTLAVMDGMIINVAGQTMVAPISSILETIRPSDSDLEAFGADGQLLSIRGTYVPIVDVAASLGLHRRASRSAEQVLLLVETENQSQCALSVDGISDQRQVVIKGLDGVCGKLPGVSAATILGDGKIALILDTDAIAAECAANRQIISETQFEGGSTHAAAG